MTSLKWQTSNELQCSVTAQPPDLSNTVGKRVALVNTGSTSCLLNELQRYPAAVPVYVACTKSWPFDEVQPKSTMNAKLPMPMPYQLTFLIGATSMGLKLS